MSRACTSDRTVRLPAPSSHRRNDRHCCSRNAVNDTACKRPWPAWRAPWLKQRSSFPTCDTSPTLRRCLDARPCGSSWAGPTVLTPPLPAPGPATPRQIRWCCAASTRRSWAVNGEERCALRVWGWCRSGTVGVIERDVTSAPFPTPRLPASGRVCCWLFIFCRGNVVCTPGNGRWGGMGFIPLRVVCGGCVWVCAGVCECARMYGGVRGCAGVRGCVSKGAKLGLIPWSTRAGGGRNIACPTSPRNACTHVHVT